MRSEELGCAGAGIERAAAKKMLEGLREEIGRLRERIEQLEKRDAE
jgi:hypothetical protein